MDFHQFFQGPHSQGGGVPEGFAMVPFPLFLWAAQQFPALHAPTTFVTVTAPTWNDSLYERAMACSPN